MLKSGPPELPRRVTTSRSQSNPDISLRPSGGRVADITSRPMDGDSKFECTFSKTHRPMARSPRLAYF